MDLILFEGWRVGIQHPLYLKMGAEVDFLLVLEVVLFVLAVYFGGRLFKKCKQPAILGQLLVGILMGAPRRLCLS